jgi:glucan 1,3-beta-glucosidase
VGDVDQRGVIEISDLMFTTKGNTAGVILMEWNVHQEEQGSAGMWDVIFRVGGAAGTGLTMQECPWTRPFQKATSDSSTGGGDKCMACQLMLHVTSRSSIYMENMWFWVAGTL